jgi:hypothetical protein
MGRCRSVHLGLEERLFARMHRLWGPYSLLGLFLHGPTTSKPRNKTLTECLAMNHIAYIRAMLRGPFGFRYKTGVQPTFRNYLQLR